jgi:integrase
MPTIAKLPSGSWRAQVRRKGRYVSETFLRRDDALRWSRLAELSVDRNETPISSRIGRIIRFAIATAMRLDEICRVDWADVNERTRMLLIRDRKDPRNKQGNDQRIPLFGPSGYDGWTILAEQALHLGSAKGRIFPYNSRSVGTAFRRGCRALGIEDLHFHDLRHEGTSRLFEAGFAIEQVSLVTGHKDWKMLRRYTHLKPEALHAFARQA